MYVWLDLETIKFYLIKLATDFYWQPRCLFGESPHCKSDFFTTLHFYLVLTFVGAMTFITMTLSIMNDAQHKVCFSNENKNCQLSYSWFQTKQEVNGTVILPFCISLYNVQTSMHSTYLHALIMSPWIVHVSVSCASLHVLCMSPCIVHV